MPRIGMMASPMIDTVSGSAARLALAIGAVQLAGNDVRRPSLVARVDVAIRRIGG